MTDQINLPENIPKVEVKELSIDFHKLIMGTDPLERAFFMKFCGWVEETVTDTKEFLGEKIETTTKRYKVDYYARMCNEAGASFLYASIYPLIGPLLTSSTLEEDEIYNLWDGGTYSLVQKLLDSVFQGVKMIERDSTGKVVFDESTKLPKYITIRNPYEIDFVNIPDMISYCCLLYGITNKAKKGFTMTKLADSFVKSEIARTGIDTRDKDEGIIGKAGKVLFGGSKGN